MICRQGDICWADLGDPIGSAPGYRRPVVVIQSDAFNASRLATILCVPLTSNLKWAETPGNVLLKSRETGLDRDSVANVTAIVSIDRTQLTECVGRLSPRRIEHIFLGLDILLGR
ncbi:MAG: type II toxin-antitoxin system PemK/MazF family toxin [Pirellulales bacterium]|nr:type II toxin-antitoxin system PemK/MazF family toxin [Pirellulales bacterium]